MRSSGRITLKKHLNTPTPLTRMPSYFTMITIPKALQKERRSFSLLKKLKEKKVPVDGVGLQGHWSIYEPTAAELEKSITQFASLGLAVQITELDVSVHPKEHERRDKKPTDTGELTAEMTEKQAAQYKMLFDTIPKTQRHHYRRDLLECIG